MAPHSSTVARKIPWMDEPGRLQSMGSLRDTTEWLHFHFPLSCVGEGNGNPLQCSCLKNPRSLVGCRLGVAQSRTRLKRLSCSSILLLPRASMVIQTVKNLLAMQETHSNLWIRTIPWRREWQLTPGFLPGESHEQRSLMGYSPWDCRHHLQRLSLLLPKEAPYSLAVSSFHA